MIDGYLYKIFVATNALFLLVVIYGCEEVKPNNILGNMNKINSQGLEAIAENALKSPPDKWWVRDLTESYAWLENEKLYWVIDGETGDSVIAVELDDGRWDILNRPSGLKTIARLLREHIGELPTESFDATKLAEVLKDLYQDPRGHICDSEFIAYNEEMGIIDTYIKDDKNDQQVLKSLCKDVEFFRVDNITWRLEFNVLNRHGGIDGWHVHGHSNPFMIDTINLVEIKPNDSFYYPDEL